MGRRDDAMGRHKSRSDERDADVTPKREKLVTMFHPSAYKNLALILCATAAFGTTMGAVMNATKTPQAIPADVKPDDRGKEKDEKAAFQDQRNPLPKK